MTTARDGGKVVESDYWENRWSVYRPPIYSVPPAMHDVLAQHLPVQPLWTVFEVGCAPGRNLVYFHKEFKYRVAGVDYVKSLDSTWATLAANGVMDAKLYQADFFDFESRLDYDVVYSGGFVEHFEDFMPAIRRHAALVRREGYLVISVPNYTHLQYLLHSVFDGPNLRNHRFEIMKPAVLRSAVTACGLDVLACGPVGTFDFWIVNRGTGVRRLLARCAEGVAGRMCALLSLLRMSKLGSVWLSPVVVCVARKP